MAQKITYGVQLAFDGPNKTRSRFVYAPGEFAAMRAQTKVERCEGCEKLIVGRKVNEVHVFSPWAELDQVEGDEISYYCQHCLDYGEDQDDSCFYCDRCNREVSNNSGYRDHQVRDPEWPDDYCCVGCAQRYMLENGHSDEQLSDGRVHCDFYSHTELRNGGWEEGETFDGRYLANTSADEWQEYCRAKIEEGYMVLTDQGATGLGNGYPDSITVWLKKRD